MHRGRLFHAIFYTIFSILAVSSGAFSEDIKESLITSDHLLSIYKHLLENHWVPQTGLFASFPDSGDTKLSQQSSTYEQGLIGLLAVELGDMNRARPMLQFLMKSWAETPHETGRQGGHGLSNFYNAEFGGEGIEKTPTVGANAWAGLFAARLGNATHDADATQFALDVAYWIANGVPHQNGAVAMAPSDDLNGTPWARIYSTENNLSYYALMTELLRCPRIHQEERESITAERDRVENWLMNTALDHKTYQVIRGITPHGLDRKQALDTATWFLSAIGPKHLAARGIDPYRFMAVAQKSFEVNVGHHAGVDPTDQAEADAIFSEQHGRTPYDRPAADAHRMIWYEGLGEYIVAWSQVAQFEDEQGNPALARQLMSKARQLTEAFDEGALPHYSGKSAYPYATPGFFFRDGWHAPMGGREGAASSLSAAAWRCFAGLGMDPMAGQTLENIRQVKIAIPKTSDLAQRPLPPVLYGTSENMTLKAWQALNSSHWDEAIVQAKATIEEWGPIALQLQSRKRSEVGQVIDYHGQPDERNQIFKYWALNDVAACYFILGKAMDANKDFTHAAQAFQQIENHFSLAQVWDPHGWFWVPADAVKDEYVLADPIHYRHVMPDVLADAAAGKLPN